MTAAPSHPLLIDTVINTIFDYFEGDRDNLASFRLVCTVWNTAAALRVKQSLNWRIGGGGLQDKGMETKGQTEARIRRNENSFMGVMDKCKKKDDLFQNFHFGPGAASETVTNTSSGPPPFWETFGPFMKTLKLFCGNGNLEYIFSCLEYTPNLEALHLYGYPLCAPATDGDKISKLGLCFPKLTTFAWIYELYFGEPDEKSKLAISQLCSFIIRSSSSPKLTQVDCESIEIASGLLRPPPNDASLVGVDSDALGRLTSLSIGHSTRADHHLTALDMDNIRQRCTGLRVLSLKLPVGRDSYNDEMETALLRLVTSLRLQLDELCLTGTPKDAGTIVTPYASWALLVPLISKFPDCPSLKKLVLVNARLWRFNFDAPSLLHLATPTILSIVPSAHAATAVPFKFMKVTTLRLDEDRLISSTEVKHLSNLFPNVRELRCALANDEALSILFITMPHLRRLYLGESRITDLGLTGLPPTTLDFIGRGCFRGHPHDGQFATKVADAEANTVPLGRGPWIGELNELEHFTLETPTLSRLSIYLGFMHLKELKYLKLKPFLVEPPFDEEPPQSLSRIETVAVRTLADSCPVLAKLDVCGTERQAAAGAGQPPNPTRAEKDKKFGCGLSDEVIAYLGTKLPTLEIVYDEAEPLSDRIRAGKADYVRVMD